MEVVMIIMMYKIQDDIMTGDMDETIIVCTVLYIVYGNFKKRQEKREKKR